MRPAQCEVPQNEEHLPRFKLGSSLVKLAFVKLARKLGNDICGGQPHRPSVNGMTLNHPDNDMHATGDI